jgi:hypothetical protein
MTPGLPAEPGCRAQAVRDTYNLLRAAAEAGVRTVVLSSTLDLFLPYPSQSDCLQTGSTSWPSWKPLPSTEPTVLGPHMAEFVAREFAHAQTGLRVTVVRLGHLLWDVRGERERKNLGGEALRFSTTLAEAVEALCKPVLTATVRRLNGPHALPRSFPHRCCWPVWGQYPLLRAADLHLLGYQVDEDPAHLLWNDAGQRGYENLCYSVVHCGISNPNVPPPRQPARKLKNARHSGSEQRQTVLITGGNGFLGPATVEAMKDAYTLRLTDVNEYGW